MASFPHNFYSDLLYPNNFSDLQTLLIAAGDNGMCNIRNNNNNNNIDFVPRDETFVPNSFDQSVSPEQSSSDTLLPLLTMQYPDLYGPVSDMTVPSLPEFNVAGTTYDIHSLINNNQPQVLGTCNYGEELLGFVPELKPLYVRDTWGSHSRYEIMHGVEETNIKVASRYSEEERKERIDRYLKKRNQRNFNKTIKYACRKTLADRRTRVRGRFARNNNELCDNDEIPLKNNQLTSPTHNQIKQRDHMNKEEEESWLQELAASLMYLPYVTNYGV